jgi:hypothetical protein
MNGRLVQGGADGCTHHTEGKGSHAMRENRDARNTCVIGAAGSSCLVTDGWRESEPLRLYSAP